MWRRESGGDAPSSLRYANDVRAGVLRFGGAVRPGQKRRRDIPALAAVADHGDRPPVVSGDHALNGRLTFRSKRDPIADLELEHLAMRAHLAQEPEAFNDAVVQIDEF